jgi:hypothetical protein
LRKSDPLGHVFDRVSQNLSLDVFRKMFWHVMSLCSVVSGVSISHRRQFEKLGKNKWCALCSISFLLVGSKVCAGKVFLVTSKNSIGREDACIASLCVLGLEHYSEFF